MKIIHCLNHFLPNHIAGTEMYVYALVKAMDKSAFDTVIVIPNYGECENDEYVFENIRIIKYAEPSIVDRDLQMGKKKPGGLEAFTLVLKEEKADVINFHELAGSNGITLHHIKVAKDAGYNVVMTFHLARYSCKTGTLMYKNKIPCDGILTIRKCTLCNYNFNGLSNSRSLLLYTIADVLYKLNMDASIWQSKAGTALGYPFIMRKLKKDLHLLAGYCDKIVVLSKWYFDVLLKNGIEEKKMVLVKQGAFNLIEKMNITESVTLPLKVIFVGRISHFKGIKLLIAALQNIEEGKIHLDIYGDSDEKEYMDECKNDSANVKNISWKGILPPGDVIRTMNEYDLLCLPSTFSEMSPLVIQEAFAAGIPVLASSVYGNAEQIINDVNGWLFTFRDVNDLTLRLQSLINDPSLIDKARKNITAVKSFGDVAEEYAELYESIKLN